MATQILRYLVLLGAVLVAGLVLASLDAIRRVDVGRWSLDTIVSWAAFTFAAMVAVTVGQLVASAEGRKALRSVVLARAVGAVGYGLAAWLLLTAIQDVLVPAWVEGAELVFAVVVVVLAIFVLVIVFTGFDDIAAALRRVPGAAQLSVGASPTGHCTQCGAPFGSGQKFCAKCGAPRT